MRRIASLLFAAVAYLSFLLAAAWAVAFLAGAHWPTSIDGSEPHPAWMAAAVDLGLLLLFAAHHSVMARAAVKRRLARLLPARVERSAYVLTASLLLLLAFWRWQPLPQRVWSIDAEPWRALVLALYATGWLTAVASTFMIDHLAFLGLRQACWRGSAPYPAPGFRERWLYTLVRHPMMAGLLIAFWATPAMSFGHLLFALAAGAYIAVGIRFGERDLRRQLGSVYGEYAGRVPALLPRPGRPRAGATSRSAEPE